MSTLNKIAAIISNAIANSPALSAKLNSKAVYGGLLPAGVTTGVTIDGSFSMDDEKRAKRGATLHLFMPIATKPSQTGDIEDLADALVAALRGSAILTSSWTRQADAEHNVDDVVFPVTIYLDLL